MPRIVGDGNIAIRELDDGSLEIFLRGVPSDRPAWLIVPKADRHSFMGAHLLAEDVSEGTIGAVMVQVPEE